MRFDFNPTVSMMTSDYMKAKLTILRTTTTPEEDDPSKEIYFGNAAITQGTDKVLLAFQIDTTDPSTGQALATGRYKAYLNVTYYHSGGASYGSPHGDAITEVNVINRVDSEFGNRWGYDGLDQLFIQDDSGHRPEGALLVRSDAVSVWYPGSGGTYSEATGDPEFATLAKVDDDYALTSRDGTVRTFNSSGRLTSRADADGNTYTYEYDTATGTKLEKIKDALDRETSLAYDGNGLLSTVTDYVGRVTEYTYEPRTKGASGTTYVVTSIKHPDPDGGGPLARPETNYAYENFDTGFNWLMTSIIGPEPGQGQPRPVTKFTYDFAGRAESVLHPDGTLEEFNPLQSQSLTDFGIAGDDAAHVAQLVVFAGDGGSASVTANQTARSGAKRDYQMDRFGYETLSKDASGYEISYQRNAIGQVTKIIEDDPDGAGPLGDLETEFDYDDGDLASITWADGSVRSFTYDGSHRLQTVTDELGRVTKFGYSGSGRRPVYVQQAVGALDNIGYHSSTGEVEDVVDDIVWSFKFTTAPSNGIPGGLILKAYDPLGRVTEYDYYSVTDEPAKHQYWGQLKKVTLPSVSGESTPRSIKYDYDGYGFLNNIVHAGDNVDNRITDYLNDALGRLIKTTLPDPDGSGGEYTARPEYRYFYDGLDRLVATIDPAVSGIGGATAPAVSPGSVTVNAASDALYTEIDLTQYFSDDLDGDLALTYVVTGNSKAATFDAVRFPADKPGRLVLDHNKDVTSDTSVLTVKAVDTDGNVSGALTITVNVGSSEEFRINNATTNLQRRPTIASLPDGGFVSAWMEQINTGGGSDEKIVARLMNADGTARTDDFVVQSGVEIATTSQYPPAVTVTEDGVIVIAWFHLNGSDYDVFFRRYRLDGAAADASAQALASDDANDQYVPALAPLPKQGFLAVWYGGNLATSAADVYYRRFDSDGEPIDVAQVTVNTTTANGQFRPSVAVGADGFLVSWQGNGAGDNYGVFARKYDRSGTALTGVEQRLNVTYTADLQRDTDAAYLADGSYVVVWQGDTDPDSGVNAYDIFYRRIDAAGSPLGGAETLVNTTSGLNESSPKVTALPSGGFVAAWHRPQVGGQGVFARGFDAAYTGDGGETAINVTTGGDQYFTDLITHEDGSLIYAWEGSGPGDSHGVFGRFFPIDFAVTTPYRVTGLELGPVVRGKLDYAIVSFSEPIKSGSVAAGDFTLTGPGGGVTITSAALVSRTQVLVGFSSYASAAGDYALTVGTGIERVSDSATLGASYTAGFHRAGGPVTNRIYDAEGRVVAVIDGAGGRSSFAYTALGSLLTETDPLGRTTRYKYDARGLLTKAILPDPDGAGGAAAPEIEYAYYADGSLKEVEDELGNTTTYRYDTRHRLAELERPGSVLTTYQYTQAGELSIVTDPLGHMQTTSYDDAGRVVKSSYLADASTKVTRDDDDSSPSFVATGPGWTEDNGAGYSGHQWASAAGTNTAKWEFSGLERHKTYEVFVTWVADGGRSSSVPYSVYDGTDSGSLLANIPVNQQEAPGGSTVVFTDHEGKWHSLGDFTVTNVDGKLTVKLGDVASGTVSADAVRIIESSPTRYEYDAAGNLRFITDAMGSVTEQAFDARDRRTDLYLPHPSTGAGSGGGRPHTAFSFNAYGNLTSLTDPVGNVTSWDYDNLGRVTAETDELSHAREYKYDAASNLERVIDRLGRVRAFAYDQAYRLTREQWFADVNDNSADRTLSYAFDVAGQLLTASDPAASYTYAYDNLGRVTQSTSDIAGLANSVAHVFQQFAYDARSQRTEAKVSYGATIGATKDFRNTYLYDDLGRLEVLKQQGWGGNTVSEKYVDFDYNALGQFTQIARYDEADGPTGSDEVVTSAYGYDDLGRLISLDHTDVSNSALRAGYEWTHNANGWLTSMDFLPSGWNSEDATFTYDKNGQVTGVTRGGAGNESYSFDLNGNRTGGSYSTTDDNRLLLDGTYGYNYDDEGNLISRELLSTGALTEYAYDHRNRLVSVTEKTSGGTATKIVEYAYDAFDRRVAKVLNSNGAGNPERYEFYIWDGDDVVLDFVDADGGASPSASLAMRYLHGPAVDQVLAQETAGNTVRWMLADHQGTVRDLVDNTGALAGDHVVFDVFGNITSGTPGTRFTYTGQEYDPDTGLCYYNARWYDPRTGRFMTKDPIGFHANDTNQYRYVFNSAVNYTDPSGSSLFDYEVPGPAESTLTFLRWLPDSGYTLLDDAKQGAINALATPVPRPIPRNNPGLHPMVCRADMEAFRRGDPNWTATAAEAIDQYHLTMYKLTEGIIIGASAGRAGAPGPRFGGKSLPASPPIAPSRPAGPQYGSTPHNRPFTRHYGMQTGPARNIPGSVVDQACKRRGVPVPGEDKMIYYDPDNNVTVVLGRGGGVVSAHKGPPRKGQY